jgi:hypothetical protein
MVENKNVKRRGITLNSPQDARRLIRRIVDRAFEEGSELEHAGRISQLMTNWLKAWDLEKVDDIEAWLLVLETAMEKRSERDRREK